jgi:thiamine-phosphate diphosphorylase
LETPGGVRARGPALPSVSPAGSARLARAADARLMLVTPARPGNNDLDIFLDQVLAASVDLVRLRDLGLDDDALVDAARTARQVCDAHGALLFVDDRPDVALEAGADGVHLGRRLPDLAGLRAGLGPDVLLGRSVRDEHDLRRSADEDLDHVTVPVGPAVGGGDRMRVVRAAAARSPHPWFAVGGIGPSTINTVLAAGARRVGVGAAVTRSSDPASVVWNLRRALGRVH